MQGKVRLFGLNIGNSAFCKLHVLKNDGLLSVLWSER